ncbi:MAG: hypothetical protein ACYCYG_14700, partial [Bellilinea sp.]
PGAPPPYGLPGMIFPRRGVSPYAPTKQPNDPGQPYAPTKQPMIPANHTGNRKGMWMLGIGAEGIWVIKGSDVAALPNLRRLE